MVLDADWPTLVEQLRRDKELGQRRGTPQTPGQLAARARIDHLLDPETFRELGVLARRGSHTTADEEEVLVEKGTSEAVPADGLVAGWGLLEGRRAFVVADDGTVGDGVRGSAAAGKAARIRHLAPQQGCPIIQLLELGRRHPDEFVGAEYAQYGYGVDFGYELRASGEVPRAVALFGDGFEQAALECAAADFLVLVEGRARLGLHCPGLSAKEQCLAGGADYAVADERSALDLVRRFLSFLPSNRREVPPTVHSDDSSQRSCPRLAQLAAGGDAIDLAACAAEVLDEGDLLPLRAAWAPRALTALGRLDGRSMGVLGFSAQTLDAAAFEKGARLVRLCDAFHLPVLFLLDAGSPPSSGREERQLLPSAARFLAAVRQASVPRMHLVLRSGLGLELLASLTDFSGSASVSAWTGRDRPTWPDATLDPADSRAVLCQALSRLRIDVPPLWQGRREG